MSILIPGKEMPKSCRDCFVNMFTSAYPACHLAENYTAGKALVVEGLGNNIRPDGCPLIEIPPHGRLIDAGPIMKYITDGLNSADLGYDAIKVMTEIEYAPTIIEAEEGET